VVGERAGLNRQWRLLLRVTQVVSTGVYVFSAAALVLGWPVWSWGGALGLLALAKGGLFLRHLRAVSFTPREFGAFLLLQPLLDASYTVGFVQGLWRVAGGTSGRPIH
jgi:hypothetical protein